MKKVKVKKISPNADGTANILTTDGMVYTNCYPTDMKTKNTKSKIVQEVTMTYEQFTKK
jgi:hypothetical protein